jgi:hypothetical protein
METKRYMDEKKLETWVIKLSSYQEWNHVFVPIAFEVIWRLEQGDFSYANFKITEVEYGMAEKF